MRRLLPLLLLLFVSSPAAAQPPARWVFVPVFSRTVTTRPAAELAAAFERIAKIPILPTTDAAAHFESAASSEPTVLSEEQLARIMSVVGEGTKALQAGERKSGERQLDSIEKLDPKARDYLQRSPERAQALFHACLLRASALEHEKQTEAAQQQMERCVHAFPGREPMSGIPRAARTLFASTREALASEPHGRVEIVSRAGCVVRANGLALGATPLTLTLPLGAFSFQVECSPELAAPGRVHALTVQPGESRISIDTSLDEVVHTRGALWLSYPSVSARNAQMDQHGLLLSRLLDSSRVVLLVVDSGVPPGPLQVRVRELSPQPRDIETLVFSDTRLTGTVGRVTTHLLEQAQQAQQAEAAETATSSAIAPPSPAQTAASIETQPEPITEEATDEEAESSVPPSSVWRWVTAGAFGVTGAGALVVSWVAYAQRFDLRTQLYFGEVPYETRSQFAGAGVWTLSLGATGGALLAAAEPWVLPRADGIPTAAWVAGGAGVAVAALGLGFGVFDRHCSPEVTVAGQPGCGQFATDAVFGPLLALHAMPLLAVPITYLVRRWRENEDLEISLGGQSITIRGSF